MTSAMPDFKTAVQNQLLSHQLLAGLPSSISKQHCETGKTNDLDRVLEHDGGSSRASNN